MCEVSGDGVVKGIDSHKLLPAEGTYDATIDGKGVELMIDDKRTLKITPAPNKGKVTIEIK